MILDYTFFGVNNKTAELAPKEAMQFGQTLWRLLYCIRHADPAFGPVYISKIDLADGSFIAFRSVPKTPLL